MRRSFPWSFFITMALRLYQKASISSACRPCTFQAKTFSFWCVTPLLCQNLTDSRQGSSMLLCHKPCHTRPSQRNPAPITPFHTQVLGQRLTAINWEKTPRTCCRKKKHTCACCVSWLSIHSQHCFYFCKLEQSPEALFLGQTQDIKNKRNQLARRNQIQQYPLLIISLYPQQTNESMWEERNSISSPASASRACMYYHSSRLISKAWVSSQCNVHNCFHPLEKKLEAELNWFVNNVYPFSHR